MNKEQSSISKNKGQPANKQKRAYISQSEIPRLTLSEAIRLAQSLYDDFSGKPTPPHQLAVKVGNSPTSSVWQQLCGSSIAYGLTSGGYNANTISLTDLGHRVVAPTVEGDDLIAKVECALLPKIAKRFYENYNRSKFPQDKIACNILARMGAPPNRLDKVLEILKRNGEFVGIIHQTITGPFVAIDTPKPQFEKGAPLVTMEEQAEAGTELPSDTGAVKPQVSLSPLQQRVFITHGKNKEIISQLKELLSFGKFIPIIAEEHETTSKPVPDKVLEDMRSCFAGVIHISSEDELLDKEGTVHRKINENVLIEIGAAMALYGRNFILLVHKEIHLPSNLQGLYLCYYEGENLDYEATIKLLRAFNEFK
ncbi:MAG TPA: TIR domain-containing protein [archaeon]|nr:TIR domain-containing protein [archaeon]